MAKFGIMTIVLILAASSMSLATADLGASLGASSGAKPNRGNSLQSLPVPHWDIEMTGADYARVLARESLAAVELQPVLDMGKRNLDWLTHMNRMRTQPPSSRAPYSFSSAPTQQGFPLEAPRIYNRAIVQKLYDDLMAEMPESMKRVLTEGGPFTDTPPVDDDTYLSFGLKADRVYQLAARWNMMKPYLGQLAARRKQDIRGFYFLSKVENLKEKLENFGDLADDERAELSGWLIGLCFMQNSQSACETGLKSAVEDGQVWEFYSGYLPRARGAWSEFFVIPTFRSDVDWTARTPKLMTVPFVQPAKPEIASFLRVNVEDEWRWGDWRLALDYSARPSPSTTHIEFEPGTTPHVNGLAGSIITMDANAPLTEYDVQWTIRHEYGHTLGFPDCYLEFYDSEQGQIISYQLDITNLMCSRRGHLQEKHYQELKRVYYRER